MPDIAEQEPHRAVDEIRRLLNGGDSEAVLDLVGKLHASDVADILEHLETDAEQLAFLRLLPPALASDALAEMDEEEGPAELLARLEPATIAALVDELADDDAADLIGDLEPEDQERVLRSVSSPQDIRELLDYPEDTAGGIMTRELLSVPAHATAAQAIDQLRVRAEDREDFYTIFVVDRDGTLRGVVTLRNLVLAGPETRIIDLVEAPVATVAVDLDQEEVGRIISRYNLPSIGVVDRGGRLVGRITFDDVIDVVEAETTEDILRFASVSDEEQLRGTTWGAIRSRLPWLVINTITIWLAAGVVVAYQDTIERMAILAAIMPVIAGLGGNAGTQSLAVTIRRIALADETVSELWSAVGKELLVGLVNGLVIGGLVAVVATLLLGADPGLGVVVLVAMWGNLIVASTVGAFFPVVLESLGVDPAIASSIFVTACTDLFGFLFLLGLASTFLL